MSDHQKRIFIVEDELFLAFQLSDDLEQLGYEIVGPALHLQDAIKLARDEPMDAAFLDVNLGHGDTSKAVADILREREVPFVFVTAYDRHEVTFALPDDAILKKPITSEEVLATLRQRLPDAEL
ncbi:response regulator [Qipengyuania marisflavi]|uniref:Response regulator n=1 Tax=Qipengyuania marisflavi TaxID=2486356 RepID=A0A5S3P5L6_9SPHN|nr:response regulator [Qipengyuania marisflavi]TMM48332.1 response regulator [Qipengyuania marisflavi]